MRLSILSLPFYFVVFVVGVMIKDKSNILPKIKTHGPTYDRVDGSIVADALDAERIEGLVSTKKGSHILFWKLLDITLVICKLTGSFVKTLRKL